MKTVSIGSGPRGVFVVHGNDLCAELYARLGAQLAARGMRAVLCTLPGFAGEPPMASPTWARLTDAVVAELARHEAQVVLGHSMGALIALLAAARRPPTLRHLVLMEPAIFARRWLARAAARRYVRAVIEGPRDAFDNDGGGLRRVYDPARFPRAAIERYLEARCATHAPVVRRLFEQIPDLYPLPWAEVGVPVLLITGAGTGWRGRAIARGVRGALRGAGRELRHEVIEGAAHWIIYERDAAVAELVASLS